MFNAVPGAIDERLGILERCLKTWDIGSMIHRPTPKRFCPRANVAKCASYWNQADYFMDKSWSSKCVFAMRRATRL